jgi:hypothetical protein
MADEFTPPRILTEDGEVILTEDGDAIVTEDVSEPTPATYARPKKWFPALRSRRPVRLR